MRDPHTHNLKTNQCMVLENVITPKRHVFHGVDYPTRTTKLGNLFFPSLSRDHPIEIFESLCPSLTD